MFLFRYLGIEPEQVYFTQVGDRDHYHSKRKNSQNTGWREREYGDPSIFTSDRGQTGV